MQSETMRLMPRLLLKQRIGRSKKLIAQRVRYVAFWVRRFLPKSRLADRPVLLWRELNSLPADLSSTTSLLRSVQLTATNKLFFNFILLISNALFNIDRSRCRSTTADRRHTRTQSKVGIKVIAPSEERFKGNIIC